MPGDRTSPLQADMAREVAGLARLAGDREATDIPGVRLAVISAHLERDLQEYLRFRHLFRNIYGFDLRWELLDRLARRLPIVEKELASQLQNFSAFLAALGGSAQRSGTRLATPTS